MNTKCIMAVLLEDFYQTFCEVKDLSANSSNVEKLFVKYKTIGTVLTAEKIDETIFDDCLTTYPQSDL